MKIILNIIFAIIIVILKYYLAVRICEPIRFDSEKDAREAMCMNPIIMPVTGRINE